MTCGAVILAAGAATRFGSPKQLAEMNGETLLQRAMRTCEEAGLQPIVVVLGANADVIRRSINSKNVIVVINDCWQEGMGASLRKGIDALAQSSTGAAVVLTCDMPFVGADHLRSLAIRAEETGRSVASRYDDHNGAPACFVRSDFAALLHSSGDSGGKVLLKEAPFVELPDARDIDTLEQLLAV